MVTFSDFICNNKETDLKELLNVSEEDIKEYLDKTDTNKIYIGVSYELYLKGSLNKDSIKIKVFFEKILKKHFSNHDINGDRVVIRKNDIAYILYFRGLNLRSMNKVNPRTYEGLTNGAILKGNLKMTKKDFSFLKPFIIEYPFLEEDLRQYFLKGDF